MSHHIPSDFAKLLDHLHRGGGFGFWAYESAARKTDNPDRPAERRSEWWPCEQRRLLPSIEGPNGLRHVWYGVHPCGSIPTKNGKGEAREPQWLRSQSDLISVINCLYAEFDAKDFGGKEAALSHVDKFPLKPSVLVDSGGGWHCYWLLDQPWHLDDSNRAEARALQHAWVATVGGDEGAKNLNRVLRVPGSLNVKTSYAPDYPRVEIKLFSNRVYDLATLKGAVPVEALERAEGGEPSAASLDDYSRASTLLKLLSSHRLDSYQEWIEVGMSLRSLGAAGLAMWDEWSRGSSKYKRGSCDAKWAGFGEGGRTFASLVQWAKEDSPQEFERLFGRKRHDPRGTGQNASRQGEEPSNEPDDRAWVDSLLWRMDRHGERVALKREGLNALRIFTHDRPWADIFAFDEASQGPVFMHPPPFSIDYALGTETRQYPCQINEVDYIRIGYWLSEHWGLSLPPDVLAGAVLVSANTRKINSLRDPIAALPWDGVPRLDNWLHTYLGAVPFASQKDEYLRWVGRWWMISAVARVFRPGCKADHVLVLEGDEGLGKSTALRILGGAGYADTQVHIGDKDAYLHIRGKWIIELAELDSLMRTESSASKAFFSSAIDRYRAPYGRSMVEVPRTCVFAGSVNHSDYIRDASGGRRYWPVLCKRVDLEALARDRDQLWGEAVELFRAGERWYPLDERERAALSEEQSARMVDDPWESSIRDWLIGRSQASPADILSDALSMRVENQDKRAQTRVGIIMQRLGWIRRRDRGSIAAPGRIATYYTQEGGKHE